MITNDNPLQAFNEDPEREQPALTDFVPNPDEVAPVSNKASNTNLAAHAALFSHSTEDVVNNYDAVSGQMNEEGKSSVADNLINSAQAVEHEKAKAVLPTLLADPTISDDDKLKAIQNIYDKESAIYHPANILASEALAQAVPGESAESENVRFDSAKMINRSSEIRRAQQNLLNAELAKSNPSMTSKILDIVQLMVPFTNQYMTAKARSEATGEGVWSYIKSFVNPAGAKQDIRDMLMNTDPANRILMTQKLIDVVNNTQGIVMSRPNDFARVQLLQEIVGQDNVSDVVKWADNFSAIADLAFGAGTIFKAAKDVKDVAKVVNTVGDATGDFRGVDAATEARPKGWYGPEKSEVEQELSRQIKDWEASKPVASDFEKSVQESIDSTKKARRSSEEVNFSKAISQWKASKPKASDVEASLAKQIKNFGRRTGPRASNTEKTLADEIAEFQAKRMEDVPNVVVSKVQPASVSQVLKDTNSDKFRGVHSAMAGDTSGKVADAAYGTTREDAIVSDIAPQVATQSGAVTAKVAVPDANYLKSLTPDTDLEAFVKQDGALYYTDAQKAANTSRIVNDFHQAFGVTSRKEMFQLAAGSKVEHESLGNGVRIKSVYGPQESGFHDPQSAIDAVKFALRDYGVGDESIQLLKRDGGDYIPVSRELAIKAGPGDYLVQVNHDYKFNPFNMTDWPKNKVKNNWFMRSSLLQGSSGAGSAQRHLVNITSMLEPHITLSMSKAVTKEAGVMREFVKLGNDVVKSYVKLGNEEKSLVMDMIKEGNLKGKWWSDLEMTAAGLSEKAKDTLNSWRKYWDNHYHFENIDHTRTLSNNGYMKYVNSTNDTNLWARPIKSVNSVPTNVKVYDAELDVVRTIKDNELADLYNSNGRIAELEHVELHNGQEFQHIISRETADGGYLRAFNDFDHTLNYRPGYFHVAYKDPHFIIKSIVNSSGKEVGTRAVATAANMKDASIMVERLKATDGGTYTIRGAEKTEAGRALDYRSVERAKGRSAQRLRGERLENSSSIISDPSYSHIQDPLEAMISSARSISRRISMRDPIEAMKKGLMEQYAQFMPKIDGQVRFPNNILDIKNPTGNTRLDKEVSAARSTYEYIQQMESGYVNHIDDGYKALMNKIGNMLGEISVDSRGLKSKAAQVGETAARKAADVRPTSAARSTANTMFIVTNPLRQLLVQGHQVMQIVPMAPKFFANPRSSAQVIFLISKQMGIETPKEALKALGMTAKEAEDMWTHFKLSGNYAAVDSHTMINASMKNFVDGLTPARTTLGRVGQIAALPVRAARKVGFDAGENFNQTVAWLAFRDNAIREGKSMADPATRDLVAATATNFTGNMNRAGQNAYEANALNVGLQFMGWAHRWSGIMTGSRIFSAEQKAKLWAWQTLMYGIPGGYAGYGAFEKLLPKDPDAKDKIVQGLVGASYNKLASMLSGEEVKANWSQSLNPLDMYGTASHLKEVLTGDLSKFFADSPAGMLVFGGNPQITNLLKDTAKWVGLSEDNKDHPTKLSTVALDFAKMFGGLSNAFKAKYAMETGKKLSSWTGKTTDSNITNTQAILLAFGVPDIDEAKTRYINQVMFDEYKDLEDDVKKFHDERKRVLLNDDLTPDQFKYYLDMTNEFFRAYPNNDLANNMYKKLVDKDIQSGDTRIINQLMAMHNLVGKDKAIALANMYPDTDAATRQQYLDTIEYLYSDFKKDEDEQEK